MKRNNWKWKGVAAVLSAVMTVSLGSFAVMADQEVQNDRIAAVVSESNISENETTDIQNPTDSQSLPEETTTASGTEKVTDAGQATENSQNQEKADAVSENQNSLENDQDSAENGEADLTGEGESETENEVNSSPMYRLYNPNTGEHFYTSSSNEATRTRNAGWTYEGIGWYAPYSGTPVYRLYNPNAGDHHYTMNNGERLYLASQGWIDEGVRFYSSDQEEIRLTRQYNPNAKSGAHNYTSNAGEAAYLIEIGWRDEGTAWYATAAGRNANVSDLGATTWYQGKDYSEIYDFNYYISHNDLESKYANDDQGAIKYFVETGLFNQQQAKEGVSPSSEIYTKYRKASAAYIKYVQEHSDKNLVFANNYSSNTNYLITVNRNTHMVYVYQGSQGEWKKINSFACGDGAASTPTVEGKFSIYGHKYYFDSGSVRCFYASMFYGAYYFHSTLYAQTSSPRTEVDGRVGMALSHGCVRLKLQNAKWIYNNIPTGTAVVVSRW